MADTEDTPCDVCRGTDRPGAASITLCGDCWRSLTMSAAPTCNHLLTEAEFRRLQLDDREDTSRLSRKQGHSAWCALSCYRGTTCDCDWFEQQGRGFGEGPPGYRAVVVKWPLAC